MTRAAELLSWLRSPQGRRVLVAGAGRQGASAARLCRKLGAEVRIADDAPRDKVEAALTAAGLDGTALDVHAGGFLPEHVEGMDLVVLSAGLPRRHPAVQRALSLGLPLVNEVELGAAHLPGAVFAGITGTNGKSTTTTLLGAIAASFDASSFAGGNLGTPVCDLAFEERRPRVAVIELSSYQLETITTLPLTAAVVTNLAPDHLDRYAGVEDYFAAKARILDLVTEAGASSVNRGDANSRRVLDPRRTGRAFDFDVVPGGDGVAVDGSELEVRVGGDVERLMLDNPRLVGQHNVLNAAAAVAAAAILGVPPDHWRSGLAAWPGIEHRLERIGEAAGLAWFNDSKATNVDAAVTAVRSFESGVHLIAGGKGKGSPYEPLVEAARGRVAGVYTIGEDGPAIAAAFAGAAPVVEAGTLERAVALVVERACAGDVLLLAPACASFDQFTDYKARGEALRRLFEAAGGSR